MLSTTLLCIIPIIAMLYIPALLLNVALWWTRLLGYKVTIKRAAFLQLGGVEIKSKALEAGIGKICLKFHRPRFTAPYFLSISAVDLECKESYAHTSIERCTIRLLLFPIQLGFSAGPWIETHFDEFRVHVYGSKNTPEWLGKMRDNIVHAILAGETIRLNSLKTKLYLSKSMDVQTSETPGDGTLSKKQEYVDGHDDTVVHDSTDAKTDKQERDDVRVRGSASQWHIFNPKNRRIYSFDSVETELRRSWLESRGSLVLITEECRWTKVAWDHGSVWASTCSKTGPSISIW
ncbi:hypothetical protein CVT24_010112 [Panaeolus cyanescens]|uniref:Uncharacterized protein n=1 Tax=Panaeolus cyanescens TaxID=181874 RepID=A0A409WMN1_9AGAR|nr:hypothetical protein CVT24_010112 [Panaeolus cyanescens]